MYVFFFFFFLIIMLYPRDGYCLCGLRKYKYKLSALIGFVNILFIVTTITKRSKEIIENIKLKS